MSGDTITFKPTTGVSPTFVGKGSKIEHPDILPIFRGAYWPGNGDFSVDKIMQAVRTLLNGPYLNGIQQYGYVGPVQLRLATIDSTPISIPLPTSAPGVAQSSTVNSAAFAYVSWLLKNDKIDNVDDNHDLIVVVFLDPDISAPVDISSAGNSSTVSGSNSTITQFEFLDDNTRFEWAWVSTSNRTVDDALKTFSHELVESITDPFNSGWEQTAPPPPAGSDQIADPCNQRALVDGVGVSAYWSIADQACIVPSSGTRRVSLSKIVAKPMPYDGPTRQGYIHLPAICGGAAYFNYFERTYLNSLKIIANLEDYESPNILFTINGSSVSMLEGTLEVPCTWQDEPPSNPLFPDFDLKPSTAVLSTFWAGVRSNELDINVGPKAGNVVLDIVVSVIEDFDSIEVGGGSTKRASPLLFSLTNQEIIPDANHDKVVKDCNYRMRLSNHLGVILGIPQPGDPSDLVDVITRALHDSTPSRAQHLAKAADLVKSSRPELSNALMSLSERVS